MFTGGSHLVGWSGLKVRNQSRSISRRRGGYLGTSKHSAEPEHVFLWEMKRQEENPQSGAGFNHGGSFLFADELGFHLVVNGKMLWYFKLGSDTEFLEG